MTIEELRKHEIDCNSFEEMRDVYQILRNAGESVDDVIASYTCTYSSKLKRWETWGRPLSPNPKLSFKDFVATFKTDYLWG